MVLAATTEANNPNYAVSANQWNAVLTAIGATVTKNKICCVGDSITEGVLQYDVGQSYPEWLQWLSGQTILNAGVGGDNIAAVLTRLPALIAQGFGTFIILVGTNDSWGSTTARTECAAITQLLLNNGCTPLWCTVLPRTDTTDRLPWIRNHNNWLVEHCREYGLTLIDTFSAFSDVSGQPKADYLLAGIAPNLTLHPSAIGYKALADAVLPHIPAYSPPWTIAGETLLYSDPTFLADTNADGLANGWVLGTSGVSASTTLVPHPTAGNWQRLSISGGSGTGSYANVSNEFSANPSVGSTVDVAFDLMTNSALDGNAVEVLLNYRTTGALIGPGSIIKYMWVPVSYNGQFTNTADADHNSAMRVHTSFVAPAGVITIQLMVRMYGANTTAVQIGRLKIKAR